ncbi:MAG: ComEC/Rec2 family competence protein [Candidatus Brennerbacteria bacterium]|nr:ComEC/Rec2 family competence protein [Candidatus Brennerbacteria bacterium]
MTPDVLFFWSAIAFMIGAGLASFLPLILVLPLAMLGAAIFIFWLVLKKQIISWQYFIILFFILAGVFYNSLYFKYEKKFSEIFNNSLFIGISNGLQNFKSKVENNIEKVLDSQKAAFLNGLILGDRQNFSKEFRDDLNKSGTTHLVALSGYNIAIIILALNGFFGSFFSRRFLFVPIVFAIIAFVAMTGAASSVVRAAIMAGLILLAERTDRLYNTRNAIIAAALLMTLANPRVIAFDWGFQLSFAAVLGLIYIRPWLLKIFGKEAGFLAWKENLLTTTSAQIAVLPLLIWHFGYFSPFSLIANVLILEAVPLTMFMGFLIGALGFFSYSLSLIAGWFVSLLLGYEIFVIKLFANLSLLFF